MDIKLSKQNTLFRKLFSIVFLISLLPILVFGVLSLIYGNAENYIALSFILLTILIITFLLSFYGAYIISTRISNPITQLKESATEIARGNFSHKIEVHSDDEVGRLAKIFNYMTTELRRLNEMNLNKIISEKTKTETIIKNIADGVIVTDPKNKILVLNSVAESWFELKEKDVIHTPLENHFGQHDELLELMKKVQDQGNHNDISVEIKHKPKKFHKDIILQAKAARVVTGEGKLLGIVTIFRDVTKEKEIDRMKTELVSMVAHELRSPLTSISGFSELLIDKTITKEQSKEYAEIILSESNRLGDLINKFLDISRIEAGKSQINKMPLNLGFIVQNIIEMNKYQANKKNINVDVDIVKDLPLVLADKEMMDEVILNLFSNAIKYSPSGTKITIRIEENDGELLVAVKDQGFGISKKAIEKIFDKFYRVTDNERVKDITGSGLGLSLVKEIIQIHNGNIWVESELGKGSTFYFTLPVLDKTEDCSQLKEFETELIA